MQASRAAVSQRSRGKLGEGRGEGRRRLGHPGEALLGDDPRLEQMDRAVDHQWRRV